MAAASIMGVNRRTPCTTPQRFTPSTHSQSLTEFSHTRPPAPTPALLNTRCGAPKRACTSAASCSICAAFDTSTLRASTWQPAACASAAAWSRASCCTSTSTRFMPSLAPMRAHSSPKPEPAPVRTAVLPAKLSIIFRLLEIVGIASAAQHGRGLGQGCRARAAPRRGHRPPSRIAPAIRKKGEGAKRLRGMPGAHSRCAGNAHAPCPHAGRCGAACSGCAWQPRVRLRSAPGQSSRRSR